MKNVRKPKTEKVMICPACKQVATFTVTIEPECNDEEISFTMTFL